MFLACAPCCTYVVGISFSHSFRHSSFIVKHCTTAQVPGSLQLLRRIDFTLYQVNISWATDRIDRVTNAASPALQWRCVVNLEVLTVTVHNLVNYLASSNTRRRQPAQVLLRRNSLLALPANCWNSNDKVRHLTGKRSRKRESHLGHQHRCECFTVFITNNVATCCTYYELIDSLDSQK